MAIFDTSFEEFAYISETVTDRAILSKFSTQRVIEDYRG